MVESFPIPPKYFDSDAEDREITGNMETTLALFDSLGVKATFFVLGRIAEHLPNVIRQIADHGHELASHSFQHKRIFNQSAAEFRQDVLRSKKLLEDISGQRVIGFRAPDFSIREDNRWALDTLLEAGFTYDSSLVPTDIHDVYGISGISPAIHRLPNGLYEFPISTFRCLGKRIPFGGGGYMRLYPIWLTRYLLKRAGRRRQSCMLYMHPYEIGPLAPRIGGMTAARRFRHYYHISHGDNRLKHFARGFKFTTAASILQGQGSGA